MLNRPRLIAVLLFTALQLSAAADQISLTIGPAQRFQTIQGFGACLSLGASPPYDQDWYQTLYARDLGCSIVRMELTPWVLGKDITLPVRLGDDIEADIRLMDFSAAGGRNAATFIRAINQKKLDRLLLIGSLWTPPHWMKDGAVIHYGNNSGGGHLKMDADNLEQFARYVSAYVKGFERVCGVPFYAVSLQNELMFKEPYNSCQYTPQEYHDAVAAVGRAFARYGIITKIMGPEGMAPNGDFFTGKQMGWIDAVQTDPETAGFLGFFCGHGHGDGEDDFRQYWSKIAGFGKESWVTEWAGEFPDWIHFDNQGKPDGALAMAWHLHEMLADGNNSAALYWQCSDGGPKLTDQNLTGNAPESANASTKFAVARNFFRWIRPGAVRVAITPESPELGASAYVHEKPRTLTIELVNTSDHGHAIRIQLLAEAPPKAFKAFRSTATERCAAQPDLIPTGGVINFTLPAEAVMTLYGQ